MPRIAIVGPGRSGKDTAAMALHGHGEFIFTGSLSWHALPMVSVHLKLPEQIAWDTRHSRRQEWYDYCNWLRRDDPCFLIRRALEAGNIVSGIRDRVEIESAISENLFDAILWVDRPIISIDPTLTYGPSFSTDRIDNDGSEKMFADDVRIWARGKGFLPDLELLQ